MPHTQHHPSITGGTADTELASRAAAGDAAAFEAIMRRHNRLLFRTARSILKSDPEAEDALQDAFLAQHFKLQGALYPRHFVPSVDAFERALELGMGWGMVPDLLLAQRQGRPVLQEVLPGRTVDVMLYWQHWGHEPVAAQRLTEAVKQAARAQLLQN